MIAVMRLMKRMSEGSVDKIGVDAYFFRASESECNGYELPIFDAPHCVRL